MTIAADEFERLFEDIWLAAAGEPSVAADAIGEAEGASHTGQVQLAGEWSGAVLIEMSDALAGTMAAYMFGLEPSELESDDVSDAVGELANMVGGNLKAHLGVKASLSLPSVTAGNRYRVKVQGSKVICELRRSCGNEPLVVRLLEGATG